MNFNKEHAQFLFTRIKPFRRKLKKWELLFIKSVNKKTKINENITDDVIEKLYQINRWVRKRSGIKKEKALI